MFNQFVKPSIFVRITNWFAGRHTFFALGFSITGTVMAFKGILTPTYVSLIIALQAFILTHSYKEDVAAQNGVQVNNTTVVEEPTPGPGN